MKDKTTANLTNFKPSGGLGEMFEKAKMHNHFNSLLQGLLPSQFKGITLCLVKEQKVTLLAPNPSIAYRAEKQRRRCWLSFNRSTDCHQSKQCQSS